MKYSKRKNEKHNKLWITNGTANSIRQKNNLHKILCLAKDPKRKEELQKLYKAYKNHVTNLSRRSKESYFKNLFEENKKNTYKIWQEIKILININTQTNYAPICLQIKDSIVTDSKVIANEFNNFFNSIASNIDSKIIQTKTNFQDTLKNPNENSFFIYPTTKEEIEDNIKLLNNHKTTGPNSIPTQILKQFKKTLSEPLNNLINLSFTTGVFPNIAKFAKIVPLYKKQNKLECNNYRPISLLSNIGKLIEKLLHKRLYSFLDQSKCLFGSQFGFRPHHSTNHALISITEHIRSALDKNNFTCGVFLDFQKVFDTVNHCILLSKLSYYGVRGIAHDLFKSYLTNRKQHTIINEMISSVLSITHGVPQGSVLGSLLFLIYINDLNHVVKLSTVHHFADDTNLIYSNSLLKSINKCIIHDLRLIGHWLRANRISLNVNKTEIVLFRPKKKIICKNMHFCINDQKVTLTTHTRYLGILTDQHLSWDQHLKLLRQKRYYLSPKLLRTLYFSIFGHISDMAVKSGDRTVTII